MTQPDGKHDQKSNDLAEELRELGQQLENLFRTSVESERAREMRRDIANGMREIGTQMQSALKAVAENPQVQNLAERGQRAFEEAQEKPVVKEFQETLARGLAQLNSQLTDFVTRMNTSAAASPTPSGDAASPTTPTNIPVETEPNTGETRRLDPDK